MNSSYCCELGGVDIHQVCSWQLQPSEEIERPISSLAVS
jgi:hypothetical protein